MECRIFRKASYSSILQMQRTEFIYRVAARKEKRQMPDDLIIYAEHTPVYTIGRHGHWSHFLDSREYLEAQGVEFADVERGGDITFHGPGQLTVYPIIDLARHRLGVKDYVCLLEESVIKTIGLYGIKGERINGAPGVWIGAGTSMERKICAVGIKCSHYISMHGLALNIDTEMDWFARIHPCGFIDKGVTSIALETGASFSFESVMHDFDRIFQSLII